MTFDIFANAIYRASGARLCRGVEADERVAASMDAPIDVGLLVKLFVEVFGIHPKLPSRTASSALLTRDDFTRKLLTSRLLQTYDSQQGSKLREKISQDNAFVV